MQNVSASSSGNAPKHLLSADRKNPTNCYVVNGSASEGIKLALNHPNVPHSVPALMLGERRYVGRHRVSPRGCLYEVVNGEGVVRRAMLEEIPLPSGINIPVLSRLDVEKPSYLLVHVLFGLAENATLRPGVQPLYAGVRGGALVSDGSNEALMRVKDGDSLRIFYPQGHVGTIDYTGIVGGKKVTIFDAELSLAERLDLVDEMLLSADDLAEDRRVEAQNRAFEELATMLAMTKIYPGMRGKIMARLEKIALRNPLTEQARQNISGVLKAVGSVTHYGWLSSQTSISVQMHTDTGISPKKYDGELHGLITEAMDGSVDWLYLTSRLVKASEDGQLRPGVRSRFLLQCRFSELTDQVAKLPYVEGVKQAPSTSPLGSKTKENSLAMEKARKKARSEADQTFRNKMKTPNNGGGGKQQGKGKKK